MAVNDFLWRYRYRFNRDYLLQEFSAMQRFEALQAALGAVSEFYPRHNIHGTAIQINGSLYIELPVDFLRATAAQLTNIPSVASVVQPYTFPALSSSDEVPYGYQGQYVPVTTSERGKAAIPLTTASTSDLTIDILYDAVHRIENSGISLTVTGIPVTGETVTVGSTVFTFAASPSTDFEIPIKSTLYTQAQAITDVINRQRFTLNIIVYEEGVSVYVRPVATMPSISTTSTALTVSIVPSINTIPRSLEPDVFRWMNALLAQAQYRHALIAGEVDKAELLRQFAEQELKTLTESYYLMGLHG